MNKSNSWFKQMAVLIPLLAASGNATAEWVNVASYNSITLYVDSTTIRKKGNMVKMWSLLDLNKSDTLEGQSYKSIKTQNEFDCKEELNRMLYNSYHTGNMGNGKAFAINSNLGEMMPVPPNSGNMILWKIACGKLKLP